MRPTPSSLSLPGHFIHLQDRWSAVSSLQSFPSVRDITWANEYGGVSPLETLGEAEGGCMHISADKESQCQPGASQT